MRHIINLTIIWVTYKPVGLFPLGQRLAEAAPPSYSTCLLQPRPILPWLFLAIFVSFPTAHITALAILDQFVFLATFYTSILLLSLFKPPLKWLSVVSNLTIFFTFRTAHTSSVFGQIASLLNPPLLQLHFNFCSLSGRLGHLASFDWFNLPFDWPSLEKSTRLFHFAEVEPKCESDFFLIFYYFFSFRFELREGFK